MPPSDRGRSTKGSSSEGSVRTVECLDVENMVAGGAKFDNPGMGRCKSVMSIIPALVSLVSGFKFCFLRGAGA